jgi:sulfofructose kinase
MSLYNKVDYLISSEKFARQFSGEEDPRKALVSFDGTAPFIAVTWGSDGVYWQDDEGQHHMPAFNIEAVDTTGAGDAFHGAFALGLAQVMELRTNLRRACATAALTCLKVGARSALPDRTRVEALCEF